MSQKQVIVYVQPGWMFCHRTQEFLATKGIAFESRDITADPQALEELQKLGYMTTPVTIIDGEIVVGFDQRKLEQLLDGS